MTSNDEYVLQILLENQVVSKADADKAALKVADPQVTFAAVESVGPKVSGELIMTAVYAVGAATIAITP